MTDIQEKIRKAEQARARATDRLARLKTAARAADRRADAHRKIELGGLVIAAGCDGWDAAEIAGALLDVRTSIADPSQMKQWREQGIALLEARKIARQRGLSLLSVMVAVALGAGVLAIGWTVATAGRRTADVQAAAQQAAALSHRVTGAWAASGDFATLSTTSASARGVFQRGDLNPAGQPVDPWGGAVTLSPQGQGFSIIFAGVPAKACPGLVASSASGFTGVSVQVGTAWQQVAARGHADVAAAGVACSQAGDPLLVRFDGGRAGASFPISPLTPCSPSSTPNPPTSSTGACPLGQVTASGGTTFPTSSPTSPTVGTCMSPYGSPILTPGTATGPWSPTAATVCAPACVPSSVTPPATTTPGTGACPAGYLTPSGSSTFPTVTTTTWTPTVTTCAGPQGPATTTPGTSSSSTTPAWGSACALACVAPPSSTATQAGPPQTQAGAPIVTSVPCPAGTTGTRTSTTPTTQTRTTTETRTTTYACPTPTGPYTPTVGAWSPPGPPYGAWSAPVASGPAVITGTCTPTPPPPPPWSISSDTMCVHPVNPIGGMGGGGECKPGSAETWNNSGGIDCTWSVTISTGGSSGSVTVDNPLGAGAGTFTRSSPLTVGGHTFTVAVTTSTTSPTPGMGTCAGVVTY